MDKEFSIEVNYSTKSTYRILQYFNKKYITPLDAYLKPKFDKITKGTASPKEISDFNKGKEKYDDLILLFDSCNKAIMDYTTLESCFHTIFNKINSSNIKVSVNKNVFLPSQFKTLQTIIDLLTEINNYYKHED